jgi:hypothetical protein
VVAPQQTFQSCGTLRQQIGTGEQTQSTAVPYRKATSISLLVVLGVREDGQKMLLAIKSMGGESSEAWSFPAAIATGGRGGTR